MASDDRPLAPTLGDPSGIGPEIAPAAWRLRVPPCPRIGDPDFLGVAACRLGPSVPAAEVEPDEACEVLPRARPVLPPSSRPR